MRIYGLCDGVFRLQRKNIVSCNANMVEYACVKLVSFFAIVRAVFPPMLLIKTERMKKMDTVVQKIVALGIPGLVLLVAVATNGFAGGAAIVAALAFLGGPLGLLGGITVLGLLILISDALAAFGLEKLFDAVVCNLKEKGHSEEEIRETINGYPLSQGLKKSILEKL